MEQGGWLMLLGVVAILIIVLDGKWRVAKRAKRPLHEPLGLQQPVESPANDRAFSGGVSKPHHSTHFFPYTPQDESHPVAGMTPQGSRVGPSIRISGEIFAEESLIIMGTISGTITAKHHDVVIAEPGTVTDTIKAHTIIVDGSMTGRLHADERVELLSNARFSGTIAAERISCEAGAKLRGDITGRQ
ncbi:hypothetical protein GCM10007160_07290 [Litchfieldella qijiaojingensis]|uniref:Polymer-forming cytoskeletal protein n=1 Tax=Litchfieldella qijiaojingensis TaxID=980347 RepID=A0ABQ2YHQ5_9GAMM|nr:polymer-forming cytoskeletal protein [Halomonas qijiaojingensis]GGX82442.1 hypothetical protein GCM10007160_07290 [Halomonas qijiaojingensis]